MTQYSGKVIRKTPVTPTQASASGVWKLNEQAAAIRNNTWPVAGVPDPISRSVRLRSSASAYFNRTPAIAGNQRTWTWSGWIKLGALTSGVSFITQYTNSNNQSQARIRADGVVRFYDLVSGSFTTDIYWTPVYRDPAAWYHFMLVADTTQATNTNRIKFYVNGAQVTSTSSATWPAQNTDLRINLNVAHFIGQNGAGGEYADGYLGEINFIDGTALTPSSFGTTDPLTGAWIPMQYTGSYGTNGFYLDFKDNTSTTTLGYDYSGNSNNWTANNISLTAGSTYDSMLDVPTPWIGYSATTDTSAVTRGNYPTWNPLTAGGLVTFSEANLRALSTSASAPFNIESTIKTATTGKWYAEITVAAGVNNPVTGIGNNPATSATNTDQYAGYRTNGTYVTSGMGASSSGTPATFTTNDVIGIAYDVDAGTLSFYKNGTLQAGGFTGITAGNYSFIVRKDSASGDGGYLNCGQRPFSYSVPTGFKTLCATNLPTPTILNGASYMAATLYSGNSSSQTISNAVNGVSMQPDLVWIKSRNVGGNNHNLWDSVRGAGKALFSNLTDAEGTASNMTGFTSSGFSFSGVAFDSNTTGNNLVAWQWRANGTPAVTNTNGSITSTVSANTTAGFSVVTYTGTGANATVGHGLGVAPRMIIAKNRSLVDGWVVYHASLTSAAYFLQLNTTGAESSNSTIWNSTAPNSTVFGVGSSTNSNGNGNNIVAYCFSAVAGYSAFGSYTGNGSTDGPFVFTGFRPRWVMVKATSGALHWWVWDTGRNTYNAMNEALVPDLSVAEQSPLPIDCLSNGFKLRTSNGEMNNNGTTFIYAAFAENPFKYSNAR